MSKYKVIVNEIATAIVQRELFIESSKSEEELKEEISEIYALVDEYPPAFFSIVKNVELCKNNAPLLLKIESIKKQ